jgi:hypothetical protein
MLLQFKPLNGLTYFPLEFTIYYFELGLGMF